MTIRKKIFMLLFSLFLVPVSIWLTYCFVQSPISFFSFLPIIPKCSIYKFLLMHYPLYYILTFLFLGMLAYWFIYCYHILWWIYFTILSIGCLAGPVIWTMLVLP